jgi:hypothetical protein
MTATQPMTVVGRHRESGDEIARGVLLPADRRAGDLLAVACTGAYRHSMAALPLVAVKDGRTIELVCVGRTSPTYCPATAPASNRSRCDTSAPRAAVKRFLHGRVMCVRSSGRATQALRSAYGRRQSGDLARQCSWPPHAQRDGTRIGRVSDLVVRRDTGSEYPPVAVVFVRVRNGCGDGSGQSVC